MSKQVTDKLLIVFLDSPLSVDAHEVNTWDQSLFEQIEEHTCEVARSIDARRHVYYPSEIIEDDRWSRTRFIKHKQSEGDRGERLKEAFRNGFKKGYGRIVCIGVCCGDIHTQDIQKAFDLLNTRNSVMGPSTNGGYYLLGLSSPFEPIFDDKPWGKETLFKKTYLELMMYNKSIALLEEKVMKSAKDIVV